MNPHKGEVLLKAADKEYKLKLTTNALCELEILLDKGFPDILISASKNIPTLNEVRCLLFCACMEYHGEVDIKTAGKIIDEAGYREAWGAMVNVLALSLPDNEKKEDMVPAQKKTENKEK